MSPADSPSPAPALAPGRAVAPWLAFCAWSFVAGFFFFSARPAVQAWVRPLARTGRHFGLRTATVEFLGHAFLMFVLVVLLARALALFSRPRPSPRRLLVAATLLGLGALLVEGLQSFVGTRGVSASDAEANVLGALLGVACAWLWASPAAHLFRVYSAGQVLGKAWLEGRLALGHRASLGRGAAGSAVARGSLPAGPLLPGPLLPGRLLPGEERVLLVPADLARTFSLSVRWQGDRVTLAAGGERHDLPPDARWVVPGASRLFSFHVHYHDWLVESARAGTAPRVLVAAMLDWVHTQPRGRLDGWHPYCTSVRLVNWVALNGHLAKHLDPAERSLLLSSLAEQARHLSSHLETALGGNHLLENGVALFVAGLFLGDGRLEEQGTDVCRAEAARQVPADGGHYEGSYGYHAVMSSRLRVLSLAVARAGRPVPEWLTSVVGRMDGYARRLTRGLREPPLFGDSWGSAPLPQPAEGPQAAAHGGAPGAVAAQAPPPAAPPSPRVETFPEAGLVRLCFGGAGDVLLLRYGGFTAPGVPGHFHNDVTSYECFLEGRRLIGDSGTSSYLPDDDRAYFRSTVAHNVAVVPGLEQAELFGAFRAGSTVRGRLLRSPQGEGIAVEVDYVPTLGPTAGREVSRRIEVLPSQGFRVLDRVDGWASAVTTLVHLVPRARATLSPDGGAEVRLDDRVVRICPSAGARVEIGSGRFAGDFGPPEAATVLAVSGPQPVGYEVTAVPGAASAR